MTLGVNQGCCQSPPRFRSLANCTLLVQLIAGHASVDSAVKSVVAGRPKHHAATVPHLVALLQERIVEDVVDIWVHWVRSILWHFIQHTDKHEDLIALAAAV